ncbi:Ctf8-domain-containing protein [Dipodascopsis uninucleata]
MPSATIEVASHSQESDACSKNIFPEILDTALGLALVELQGTLHMPIQDSLHIGKIHIEGKNAYLFLGNHQRLEGKVEDLKTPLGILTRKSEAETKITQEKGASGGTAIEIVEIITKKIVFNKRPEHLVLGS